MRGAVGVVESRTTHGKPCNPGSIPGRRRSFLSASNTLYTRTFIVSGFWRDLWSFSARRLAGQDRPGRPWGTNTHTYSRSIRVGTGDQRQKMKAMKTTSVERDLTVRTIYYRT